MKATPLALPVVPAFVLMDTGEDIDAGVTVIVLPVVIAGAEVTAAVVGAVVGITAPLVVAAPGDGLMPLLLLPVLLVIVGMAAGVLAALSPQAARIRRGGGSGNPCEDTAARDRSSHNLSSSLGSHTSNGAVNDDGFVPAHSHGTAHSLANDERYVSGR